MNTKKEIDMNLLIGLMDPTYSLAYVDYSENLENSLDVIEKCLITENRSVLCESVDEWYANQKDESVFNIMGDLKKELVRMGYKKWEAEKFFEENEDEIKDIINDRDDSDPLKDIIRNTSTIPVRIELLSNYDCINSHWLESSGGYSYEESYLGDMVDALNLNPTKVKEVLRQNGEKTIGRFPNKKARNQKEHVFYQQFYEELVNSSCGANLLTYIATVNIRELYEANFSLSEILIPKGNKCGLYSSMQGGGSLIDMELKQNVKLHLNSDTYPRFRLQLEKYGRGYDYSIKQVYGVCDSFFGNPLDIISKPQLPQTA